MTRIDIEDGKYTICHENGCNLRALRYGEPWRDLVGDKLVLCMAQEIERLREQLRVALAEDDPYAVSINVGSRMQVAYVNRFRNGTSQVTIKRLPLSAKE